MYLYGIEIVVKLIMRGDKVGFNCTFMELKYKLETKYQDAQKRFNCTFMELKSDTSLWQGTDPSVLIVPLWN